MSKQQWSRLVWQQAWSIEDAYWRSANLVMKDNGLVVSTITNPNDLIRWHIADEVSGMMRMCENMAKLVCHASPLKYDDCSQKEKPMSYRVCSICDLYLPENLHHILMQCPYNQAEVATIIDDIAAECDSIGRVFANEPSEIFYRLLGKPIPGIEEAQMTVMRIIAGTGIDNIYRRVLITRTGIG